MVRVSDTEAPWSRSEVSDTGRFTRSVSAAALLCLDRVSDTGGPPLLVSDTASCLVEPGSSSKLDPKWPW